VVDVAPESLVIEITGTEDKIDGLLEVVKHYGVIEMVRTGRVAMARGSKSNGVGVSDEKAAAAAGDDSMVSYSV
jgi:acetolactate synthase-1/3 small subunit